MSLVVQIVIITSISGVVGTGIGGLIGALLKRDSQKMVSLFLSFAAGVMFSVVCFDLLLEAINSSKGICGLSRVVISLLVGYGVVFLLNYIIDRHVGKEVEHLGKEHPKTADDLGELIHSKHLEEHKRRHAGLFAAGLVMAAAIALHNLPEGVVIGASYAKDATYIFSGSGF